MNRNECSLSLSMGEGRGEGEIREMPPPLHPLPQRGGDCLFGFSGNIGLWHQVLDYSFDDETEVLSIGL